MAASAAPLVLAACSTRSGGYRGYAFVANEDGQAIAAVDLQVLAVARHIALDASPTQVIAAQTRTAIYALTPATGSVHEIQSDHLSFRRKATVASTAASMSLDTKESALYVLTNDPGKSAGSTFARFPGHRIVACRSKMTWKISRSRPMGISQRSAGAARCAW